MVVQWYLVCWCVCFFFSSRRRHTRCALVTGVQTCALPISPRSHHRRECIARAGNQLGQEIHHILRQDLRIVYDQHRPSGAVAGELCKPVLGRDRITRALPSQSRSDTRGLKRQQERRHVRRSEEHTSELQSLMRISYAVFCLKKKKTTHKLT